MDFRTDIEGLRAITILMIIGYHTGMPGFAGAFVGPDVFFVISGFLITRRVLSDSTATGSVAFAEFWARRIRRLIPALSLMVSVTLLVGLVVINPFDMLETIKEGVSSALYFSNYWFAHVSSNYFGSNPNKSPFLHTWSLAVEEQFYLVWPFVVWALLLACRRRAQWVHRASPYVFAAIFVASFALNVFWTNAGNELAFYSLPARAWEFAAGGLLGSLTSLRSLNRHVLVLSGFLGLGGLIAVTELYGASTTFPGTNALVPVLAACLIIVAGSAGTEASPVSRVLSIRPAQWTGRISYSWYLWHWPFVVFTVLAFKTDNTWAKTAAAVASLGVATLTYRYVENPIRFAKRLRRPPYKSYLLALVCTVVVLGVAGVAWHVSSARTPASFTQLEHADFLFPACQQGSGVMCYGADLTSSKTIALVGDSHSATWFNEVRKVAVKEKMRLLLISTPGCPTIDVNLHPDGFGGPINTAQCTSERAYVMSLLAKVKPVSVILTQHSGLYLGTILDSTGSVPSQAEQTSIWKDAFEAFIRKEQATGATVGVILDNPVMPQSPQECMAQSGSLSECEPSRAVALGSDRVLGGAEVQVLKQLGDVPYFSPDDVLCNASGCPLEIGGQLVYSDTNHLAYTGTELFGPQVTKMVGTLLQTSH